MGMPIEKLKARAAAEQNQALDKGCFGLESNGYSDAILARV